MTVLQRIDAKIRSMGACDWTVAYDEMVKLGFLQLSVAERTCRCGGLFYKASVGGFPGRDYSVHEGCTWSIKCTDCGKGVS